MIKPLDMSKVTPLIALAVEEDYGKGDPTSEILIEENTTAKTYLKSREDIVVCGMAVIEDILKRYDPGIIVEPNKRDGCFVSAGEQIAVLEGSLRAMLSAERVLLNFLQHLSGVATITNRYVKEIEGTKAGIYDTRKTTPGFRELEKYAVRCGGGFNHRYNLGDAVMLKDNHFANLGENHRKALQNFVQKSRQCENVKFVSVEVDNIADQLDVVLEIDGVDIVLLDNMNVKEYELAVKKRNMRNSNKPALEASGGITLENLREIADTGVDRISIGAITHGARSVDIGLDY